MAVVYLLGHPVGHSLSPAMHAAAFKALDLPHRYETWDLRVDELPRAIVRLREEDVLGANVTVPYKEAVLRHLDSYGVQARRVRAANTIVRHGRSLVGWNTDMPGFMAALAEHEVAVRDRRILVLGAGGAARAVLLVCRDNGAQVAIANRTRARADEIAAEPSEVVGWPAGDDLTRFDIVVNATSLGLAGEDALEGAYLQPELTVIDLVPTSRATRLVHRARAAGCRVMDGLPMLLHQAAASFKFWTGLEAPVDVMRTALARAVTA